MPRTTRAIAEQIEAFQVANRISHAQLRMLIDDASAQREDTALLRQTARQLDAQGAQDGLTRAGLMGIVGLLQDAFGFELDMKKIPRRGRRLQAVFAQSVGLILSVCTFTFVLGGVGAGESSLTLLYGVPVVLTFTVLLVALMLLACLEGTQIAIVALTNKKVTAFKEQYPRGCQAIQLVQNKRLVERYLAGRQFFVIFVVFIIAQVTSFPQIEMLPFTQFPIHALPDVIIFLGFKLGLFGALLVLWVAQLLPQLIANKNPLLFLNLPGMRAVIRLCLVLESMGPTRPASWMSATQRVDLTVPTSSFVKHSDMVDDVFGYEVVNQSYVWRIDSMQRWSFTFASAFGICSEGIVHLRERSLLLHGDVGQARFDNTVFRAGTTQVGGVHTPGVEASAKGDGWTQFEQVMTSNAPFQVGDVVESTYHFDGTGLADRGYVAVSTPTKLLSFCVQVDAAVLSGRRLVVKKYSQDNVTVNAQLIECRELSFSEVNPKGLQEATFIDTHPTLNVFYELEWSCTARGSATREPESRTRPAPPTAFVIQDLLLDPSKSRVT